MRILLFVISIYNTIDDISLQELKEIIDKIYEIADVENDQEIIISICDNTENKQLFMYYIRHILEFIKDKKILFGKQFLGDVYYKDIINSGAILYDEKFDKEKIILNYANELEQQDNFVNLYYVDGNMKDTVNDTFRDLNNNTSCTLIRRNGTEIIKAMERVKQHKILKLEQ